MKPTLARRFGLRVRGIPRSPRELSAVLQLSAVLRRLGWHSSARAGVSTDGSGRALPWWTYPAIHWCDERLAKTHDVFEWGSGQSTVWLTERVRTVTSIEHDAEWASRSASASPVATVRLIEVSRPSGEDAYITAVETGGPYDVVVVDGLARLRVQCIRSARDVLPRHGLLVVDDSQRPSLRQELRALATEGFSIVDFVGLQPGSSLYRSTSILTKDPVRWFQPLERSSWTA